MARTCSEIDTDKGAGVCSAPKQLMPRQNHIPDFPKAYWHLCQQPKAMPCIITGPHLLRAGELSWPASVTVTLTSTGAVAASRAAVTALPS